jgi:hypothetical protein
MSTEIDPFSDTISQTAQEGLGVGDQEIASSEMPEIGDSSETSQPDQEGLGAGDEVIAKSEMPEFRDSGDTSQPGQEGLGAGGEVIAKSEMPEIRDFGETSRPGKEGLGVGRRRRMLATSGGGESDSETSQVVCFYSFSRVHFSSFPRRVIKLQVWGLRLLEVCIMYTR